MPDERSTSRGAGRHAEKNWPPQRYSDLSYRDMLRLAPLFRPVPIPTDSSYPAFESDLRADISGLPPYLRRKPHDLTTSTTFCKMHRALSPRPIESLLRHMQRSLAPDELRLYRFPAELQLKLLGDMEISWGQPSEYFNTYLHVHYGPVAADFVAEQPFPSHGKPRKKKKQQQQQQSEWGCAACKMAGVSEDVAGMSVLGALVIAGVGKEKWKQSKRILWIECWYYALMKKLRPGVSRREILKPMWDLAVGFARARPDLQARFEEVERPYIDAYRAGDADALYHCSSARSCDGREEGYDSDGQRSAADARYLPSLPPSPGYASVASAQMPGSPGGYASGSSQFSAMQDWNRHRSSLEYPSSPISPGAASNGSYEAAYSHSAGYSASSRGRHNSMRDSEIVAQDIIDSYRR